MAPISWLCLRQLKSSKGIASGAISLLCVSALIPPNVPISGHLTGIQNNPQVAIVPWDTSQIVVTHRDSRLGYVQIALARSTDGGTTWTDTLLPPSAQRFNRQSTPTIAVGANGSVIMAHIDYATSIAGLDSSYLSTFISDDGGLNWSGPHTVMDTFGSYFENLPKLASDRTGGLFSGNIYIAWTRLSPFMSRVLFSQSGSDTLLWGAPAMPGPPGSAPCADSMGAGDHAQLAVGKDGAIYLFWRGNLQDPPPGCLTHYTMTFSKSVDGGNTWSNPRFMGTVTGGGSIDGGVSVYTRPLVAADISNGPHGGTIYVAYMDRWGTTDTDIFCLRSTDTAHTWKPPVRINDDPVGPDVDQFHNALACNEEGVLVSVWYDQRLDPGHTLFDLFAAYSYDGGATWTANHRVSSSSINPALLGGSLGEYIGLSCVDDKVVAVWADTREGDQDIWSARWSLPLTEPRLLTESGASLSCGGSLRWATAWKETQDRYRLQVATSPGSVRIFVFVGRTLNPELGGMYGQIEDSPGVIG
jgi:hypothetical protein